MNAARDRDVLRDTGQTGWIASYAVVLGCYFLNFALFQLAYPFIPLLLVEMGESQAAAIAWTGLGQACGSIALMLANPVWGGLGDRYGRKSMVLRAMGGGTITLTLMAISGQAWHLFAARILQGLVGGSSPALLTLAALTLPRSRLGMGMGLMQTAQYLGGSLGPLIGTAAVVLVGFRGTFFAAAGVMAALMVLAALFVRDRPVTPPAPGSALSLSFARRLAFVSRMPRLRGLIVATLSFQTAYTLSMTLLPLQLYTVAGSEDAARSVGIVLAAAAFGGALGAALMGVVSGRFSAGRIAVAAFISSGVLLALQVPLTTTLQFAVVRFAADFCGGAVLPALRTLLAEEAARHESTASSMGAIYGLSQSAHAGGSAAGAALSAVVAALWGIPATFGVAGVLAVSTGLGWHWLLGGLRSTPREVSHGV